MVKTARAEQQSVSLSVSCVNFRSNQEQLIATLESLVCASRFAKSRGVLSSITVYLIDNGPDEIDRLFLEGVVQRYQHEFDSLHLLTGHGNIGYGRANNLAIMQATSDYHLVLNPDVLLAEDNLSLALLYMNAHTDTVLLAPDGFGEDDQRQFLAKRNPSFLVLLARATQSQWLCRKLKNQLNRYEYRDLIPACRPVNIELASGCYMLMRTTIAREIGGFNPIFFMYFEDFDLSRRIVKFGRAVHHPDVKIIHFGGGAATKGGSHIRLFLTSYVKYILSSLSEQ